MPGLSCVSCRSYDVVQDAARYGCQDCGCVFPIIGGVAVMFGDVRLAAGTRPEGRAAQQILNAFGLPTDIAAVERLRDCFAQRVTFGGNLIQIEAAQFLDRVRNSGHPIDGDAAPSAGPPFGEPAEGFARPRWILHHLPRMLPPGEALMGNVRFENAGSAAMRHEGPGRTTIAARWTRADGEPEGPDIRTPIPLDIPPGRALTLPVRFQTPEMEGEYTLSFMLVEEQVRWIEDAGYSIPITIKRHETPMLPAQWTMNAEAFDYTADHQRGLEMLRGWLARHAPGNPRILEVGGNAIPMIERLDGELHNIDVDLAGLQLCALRQRQAGRAMTIFCADAEHLPYQAAFFDVIVIFASLHHFPDPAALLSSLRQRLKPQGFIAVMCEPVGHIWPGAVVPEFLAELRRGVNEQSFTAQEYAQIFRAAELEAAAVIIDHNSLKARLTPKLAAC